MIIAGCLLILMVLSLFSIILGSSFMGIASLQTIDNTAIVNGTSSTFVIEGVEVVFSIDPVAGAIAMIITFGTVAALLGMQFLGSGLSDASVRIVSIGIIYTTIWTLLSILAIPLMFAIEVFGALIYVTLTLAYVVGVAQKIGGGGGD